MDLTFASLKLSRGHRKVADYISKNVDDISFLVEEDIAAACGMSVSTVSRFWAEIGCRNLKEFKMKVKEEVLISPARKLQAAFDKMNADSGAAAGIASASEYLGQTAERLDEALFDEAARALGEAEAVHVYGPGSAECLAALLDFRLTRFGIRVRRLERGGHELLDGLVHVGERDVVVVFGFVAESPEIAVLLDFARERGCRTLLITDLLVSEMREKADLAIYTARGQLWEFHSMVAPIAVVETLVVATGKLREERALANGEELHRLRRQYRKWLPKRV